MSLGGVGVEEFLVFGIECGELAIDQSELSLKNFNDLSAGLELLLCGGKIARLVGEDGDNTANTDDSVSGSLFLG